MSKTTIVTFYFNLKNLRDATPSVRPQSFYMEKGRSTLKLPYPMVIFCDEKTYDQIKQIRDEEIEDRSLTKYIVKNLIEYDFYKENWDIIQQNRKHFSYCYNENNRNTSSYFLTCMFKVQALYIAKQRNYFDSAYYAWIDFGGSHILRNFDECTRKIVENPNPRVSLCYIHYRSNEELSDMRSFYANGGHCCVAATAFTVQREYVNHFYNGIFGIFHETLANEVGHSDEQTFAYYYYKYPKQCNIYYGDFYSILTNYHDITDDFSSIKNYFLEQAVNKGRPDLAKQCALKVCNSIEKGILQISIEDMEYLKKFM